MVNSMATATLLRESHIQQDHTAWLGEVRIALVTLGMKMDACQENWEFDFRKEYESGSTPFDAAVHAHDFWWQQLLAESRDECERVA